MKRKQSHLVIPDGQVKHGVPIDHWYHIGLYAADKKPDVIINLGDFADMPSLSSYDRGKKSFEGRRYTKDIGAVRAAMALLMQPIKKEMKKAGWSPRLVLTLGNHENRITRAIEDDPRLEGPLSLKHLGYEDYGWEVIDFLKPIKISGIVYSHYFPRASSGRVMQTKRGAPNALTQIKREMISCTAGHMQGLDVATYNAGDGRILRGLIAGSAYQHEEEYLSPHGNTHFRGIILKHQVKDGNYLLCEVNLDYLRLKYGHLDIPNVSAIMPVLETIKPKDTTDIECPRCGDTTIQSRGKYKQYQTRKVCSKGHWFIK